MTDQYGTAGKKRSRSTKFTTKLRKTGSCHRFEQAVGQFVCTDSVRHVTGSRLFGVLYCVLGSVFVRAVSACEFEVKSRQSPVSRRVNNALTFHACVSQTLRFFFEKIILYVSNDQMYKIIIEKTLYVLFKNDKNNM